MNYLYLKEVFIRIEIVFLLATIIIHKDKINKNI
jgi:hypothetical protein